MPWLKSFEKKFLFWLKSFEKKFLLWSILFAWIAARSMSSRLMVALVEESMVAKKRKKGRRWRDIILNWEVEKIRTLEIFTDAFGQNFSSKI